MTIGKVRSEVYGAKYDISESSDGVRDGLVEVIGDCLSRVNANANYHGRHLIWDVPGIPGGRIVLSEMMHYPKAIVKETSLELRYLENAPKEDVDEIREAIEELGLKKVANGDSD